MSTTINIIENTKNIWIKNISEITFSDVLAILPEIYLVTMSLIALIVIGMANFTPASNKMEKKNYVMPTLYKFSVNSMWYTVILCLIQLLFGWLFVKHNKTMYKRYYLV